MAQLTPEQFEELWQKAQGGQSLQPSAIQRPIGVDTSLTSILDRYVTVADGYLAKQTISKLQHDTLIAAISALKAALAAINEQDLLAQHLAAPAQALQQQVQQRVAAFVAAKKP